jgi:hypothetical protein
MLSFYNQGILNVPVKVNLVIEPASTGGTLIGHTLQNGILNEVSICNTNADFEHTTSHAVGNLLTFFPKNIQLQDASVTLSNTSHDLRLVKTEDSKGKIIIGYIHSKIEQDLLTVIIEPTATPAVGASPVTSKAVTSSMSSAPSAPIEMTTSTALSPTGMKGSASSTKSEASGDKKRKRKNRRLPILYINVGSNPVPKIHKYPRKAIQQYADIVMPQQIIAGDYFNRQRNVMVMSGLKKRSKRDSNKWVGVKTLVDLVAHIDETTHMSFFDEMLNNAEKYLGKLETLSDLVSPGDEAEVEEEDDEAEVEEEEDEAEGTSTDP